jgi:serine/threonine kinase 38
MRRRRRRKVRVVVGDQCIAWDKLLK